MSISLQHELKKKKDPFFIIPDMSFPSNASFKGLWNVNVTGYILSDVFHRCFYNKILKFYRNQIFASFCQDPGGSTPHPHFFRSKHKGQKIKIKSICNMAKISFPKQSEATANGNKTKPILHKIGECLSSILFLQQLS